MRYVGPIGSQHKLHAYTSNDPYDETAGFDLRTDNGNVGGIVWVDGLFYVLDCDDDLVDAYSFAGERDTFAGFVLRADNGSPTGIAWASGPFHVVDWPEDKVYYYSGPSPPDGGDGEKPSFGAAETITDLPTGSWRTCVGRRGLCSGGRRGGPG